MPLLSGTIDIDNSDSTEANLRVLYPLDRFGVSDKFYQELSMLFSELPRSNAVKKKRTELNDILDLIRIEGYEGAIGRLKVLCANTCQYW